MAVLPGSLDYLYYNGILDRIPYEAYEQSPITASGRAQMAGLNSNMPFNNSYGTFSNNIHMNGSQYLKYAQNGALYNNTLTHPDIFVKRSHPNMQVNDARSFINKTFADGQGYGAGLDYEVKAIGEDGKAMRKAVTDTASKAVGSFMDSPLWVKGFVGATIMVGTLYGLFKGKKPAVSKTINSTPNQGFWSKLNPANWFKK